MLTAGHCTEALGMPGGALVYHSTTQIGTFSGSSRNGSQINDGTGIDAAVLFMNDRWTALDNVIHSGGSRDIRDSTDTYTAGSYRCWTGMVSATKCGYIKCETLTFQASDNNRWYSDMFTIDPSGAGGDSGGPAYRPNSDGTASVTGVKHGSGSGASCMNGTDSIFTKWHRVRDYFGLTLVTDG
jgi:hypothetical protein